MSAFTLNYLTQLVDRKMFSVKENFQITAFYVHCKQKELGKRWDTNPMKLDEPAT